MNTVLNNAEQKMSKTIQVLISEYAAVRAGRANPAILDKVSVDYYGVPTPVNQLSAVSVPDARTILIQPWDKSVLKDIEKAIQISDIGINPQNDGNCIRLTFPPLTEERRRQIAKDVAKLAEDAKVAVRAVRRDAIDKFKDMKKKGELTEDELKIAEKKIQDLTDKYCNEIDSIAAKKEKEIMEI
ncbi:MAG TPA: ribosome recycling factor [Candidatus Avimonas sp.]|nr:ribosome recycling factor [Candidatus Avimonas sp.]